MFARIIVLSDVCSGRNNNLNLIRMVAACAVLVSHAWPITMGPEAVQPLQAKTGYALGGLAVFVFFSISGFLIARSYERQPTLRLWLLARALRLFPALAVMLLLTALALGPVMTALPLGAYLADPETLSYVPNNLSLALRQGALPGVFLGQPLPVETNGSLWTLFYEVLCYFGVLLMGLLGAFKAWRPLAAAAALYVLANAAAVVLPHDSMPDVLRTLLSLGMPFAVGVAFYIGRRRLPLHPLILAVLVAGAVLVKGTPLYHPALVLTLSYGVFLLAYLPGGLIRDYNAVGDFSYGIYIYAWPVQQTMVAAFGPMGPLLNIALALPVTLGLAALSWRLVEKPALRLVPHSDPPGHVRGVDRPPSAPLCLSDAFSEQISASPEQSSSHGR